MANIIEIATKAMQDLIKAGVDAISSKVDVNTSTRQASWGADAGTKTDIEEINTKVGLNTNGAGTTTVFARLNQIYTHLSTYLSSARAAKIDNLDVVISGRQADWGAVAATKTNIDAAKTNTDTLKTNVGSNSDASSATGSVHAKLKDIKSNLGGSVIKSIQTGYVYAGCNAGIASTEDARYIDVVVSTVDTSKYFALFQGYAAASTLYQPTVRMVNSNTLRLSLNTGVSSVSIVGRYYLVEYN